MSPTMKPMRGPLSAALVLGCSLAVPHQAAQSPAQERWTSIYIQGSKVGYSRASTQEDLRGRRVETTTVFRAEMLGARLDMSIETSSLYGKDGKPLKLEFVSTSSGRTLKVTAQFTPTSILAKSVSGGQKLDKTIPITPDMIIAEDPAAYIAEKGQAVASFHVFDPNSLSLVPVTAKDQGMKEVRVRGSLKKGRQIEVNDPRAPMTLWLNEENEMILAKGPLEMELVPDVKEQAMVLDGRADIAEASAIRPSRPLNLGASKATLKVKGAAASRFQPGPGQLVEQKGNDVVISLEPINPMERTGSLKVGESGGQEEWTKPEMRVPSDSPEILAAARAIIGTETNAIKAAEKVRKALNRDIAVNAGIGVMRDAREVLETKEGVCRDHAVLMAALLRSVGIPTMLTSGIVYQGGQFYYHAWVEVWNGKEWVPMDSTRAAARLTVGHVKIASGSVAEAFVSFLIEQKVIEVVE
jgi:hypothetical protein